MIKVNHKKIILTSLIVLFASLIFLFSSQNGQNSESLSDAFAEKIMDKVGNIRGSQFTPIEKKNIIRDTRFLVRKGAHFSVYLILGMLVYILLKCYNVKCPIRLTVLLCFIYACGDEVHQIFSPGRTARVFDIFIDTLGCLTGVLMIKLIQDKIKKKKEVKA